MGPIVARLANDFEGRALVGTVDASQTYQLNRTYGVTSVPTFVFFKGGREVARGVGPMSYESLAATLTALITP